jgi:predicted TIM-barrel fold metal-dependent hydrolase
VKTATPGIPAGLMLDSTFRAGLATLREYGVSFEAWLYHPQLLEMASLARAVPDVPMILNHVGGLLGVGPYAGRRDEIYQVWRRGIMEVAKCPNVVVKLGGLGMARCGFDWHTRPVPPTSTELVEATARYNLFCIEQFGPIRCMFESNFPVDKLSYSYGVLWNSFKRMTQNFSTAERAALFHDTAARVYRLVS